MVSLRHLRWEITLDYLGGPSDVIIRALRRGRQRVAVMKCCSQEPRKVHGLKELRVREWIPWEGIQKEPSILDF